MRPVVSFRLPGWGEFLKQNMSLDSAFESLLKLT